MSDRWATLDSPAALRAIPEADLPALCQALREEIVQICGRVGGHLGASLGAVELTVALHRVFHTPHDALVFDVGHQAYAHKLLTGRRGRMQTLRQAGGVAPFQDPTESEHDALGAGHACTAVSSALGLQEGWRQLGKSGRAVAIVGDGALTGGLTFEGLNNAGASGLPLLVLLNDNGMSISANVGAVPKLLQGPWVRPFFEGLGFTYLGPVDGHDLTALLPVLREAHRSERPVLVHARTQKGRGFPAAESDLRTRGHAMGPYELRDGKLVRARPGQTTYSEAFARALEARMAADSRVVAVTPAMVEGSALAALQARFPGRVYDVGIAEPHAVTFSAGLARAGLRPVCLLYSTFLQRAVDSIVHDVCIPGLPVIFAIDRAGLVGADGATHQGAYDVALLRPVPGLAFWAPVLGEDIEPLLSAALERSGPTALRFPRGTLSTHPLSPLVPGHARWLRRAKSTADVVLLTLGTLALPALEAAQAHPGWSVLDAGAVSPLDEATLREAAACPRWVVAEEGTTRGGLGSAVLEFLAREGLRVQVRQVGLPDAFVRHGEARAQRAELGLDAAGLTRAAQALERA